MAQWLQFPFATPSNLQVCYVRVKYYYGEPFAAYWDSSTSEFVSIPYGFRYPVWSVARWQPATNINLLSNPNFVDGSYWDVTSPNYISSNALHMPINNEENVFQLISLASATSFVLSLTIANLSGVSSIKFTDQSYNPLFSAPFNSYNSLSNGVNTFNVTTVISSDRLLFYKLYSGAGFEITHISLTNG